MVQKLVQIDGIGEVTLQKRRGTKNLRISIGAAGQVKVGMPMWVPYATGIAFARQRRDWVMTHQQRLPNHVLLPGARIGKSYRIVHIPAVVGLSVRLSGSQVIVRTNESIHASTVQKKLIKAAERALKQEAENLLPGRVRQLAGDFDYEYSDVVIKKLTSRWGSCSARGKITLSYFLMQLPWPLIDYVILHELAHTRHLNHSANFWEQVASTCKDYKSARKQIKQYTPSIIPQNVA